MSINNDDNSMARDVWCILGLPFDSINMNKAIKKVQVAAENNTPCFISTPNLNFLIQSQNDNSFRDSVINSDLSIVDGKPLVWLARLLNIPIPERVAGSDLIDELIKNKAGYKPLKVFFFCGETGVGEIACEKLDSMRSGLKCVGSLNPGFISVDAMSTGEIIDQINLSGADFLIVSLGAKKGQAWIEKNRNELKAPVISHLGAVVNFLAGAVNRAPKAWQKIGAEWLWRIKEEPALWKRYFNDGVSFLKLLILRVTPLYFTSIFFEKNRKKVKASITLSENTGTTELILAGYFGVENVNDINKVFEKILNSKIKSKVKILIEKNSYINSAVIAKIILFKRYLKELNRELVIDVNSKLVVRIFKYSCCNYLLDDKSN